MRRFKTMFFVAAAALLVPAITLAMGEIEWWWLVLQLIMQSGGTWNVW